MSQIKFETGPSKITQAFNYDRRGMGVRNKGAKRSFAPFWKLGLKTKIL